MEENKSEQELWNIEWLRPKNSNSAVSQNRLILKYYFKKQKLRNPTITCKISLILYIFINYWEEQELNQVMSFWAGFGKIFK